MTEIGGGLVPLKGLPVWKVGDCGFEHRSGV